MEKSISVLKDNFIGRLNQKKVKTSRYLWHIKYNHYQSDLQIASEGLICPKNYAVFAHNNMYKFENTYPYFMDFWDFDIETLDSFNQFFAYSFWRIDTEVVNVDWFTDPNMEDEGFNPKNYVCTLNNIPYYALKLFKYNRNNYITKLPYIKYKNGVASVRPLINDFETLIPDKKMNDYIKWRFKNFG